MLWQQAFCALVPRGHGASAVARRSFADSPGPRSGRKWLVLHKLALRSSTPSFDNLLASLKPLNRLLLLKNVLSKYPHRIMPAAHIGLSMARSGLMLHRKALRLLGRYPRIFKSSHFPLSDASFVQFTDEASKLVEEEDRLRRWYEPYVVEKVAKLLMMAVDRKLQLEHLCQLDQELGLPHDFRTRFVNQYPDIFKVVEQDGSHFLELIRWDDSLAVTARELNAEKRPVLDKTCKVIPLGFHLSFPKGHRFGLTERQNINKWQNLSFLSPYAKPEGINPNSQESGKRAVAVIHEFLSLTLEKRSSIETLDLFQKQLRLPCKLLYFLHEHYGIFYVTQKGDRHAVFLKEAYRALDDPKKVAHLIDKSPFGLLNEQFEKLMEAPVSKRIPGLARSE